MTRVFRILLALLALALGSAWTIFTAQVWQFGNSFKGMGDGAGTGDGSALLSFLLIEVIWLFLGSSYLCMAAGSLNLIKGKALRVAYAYSLIVLALLTLFELRIFHRPFVFLALGNIVAGGLWACCFQGNTPEKPQSP